ncbi:MAG: hypothetical protein HYS27_06095 [Deltaproteobacteria bacterium]|nr:hypothetical protein [Deltaproteobacteria bacterium]
MFSGLLLLLLAQTPVEATQAPAVVEPPPRILVLVPKGETVPVEVRHAIASTLTVELGKTGRFTALSSSELSQLTELEADKQATGCDTSSCLGEIAGALGARFVVFGDATQLGALLVVNLSLFDVERAASVQRTSFEVRDQADIPARARAAASALTVGGLTPDASSTSTSSSTPAPLPLLPVTLLVAGGVVVAGGLTFDAVSPTSNNHALDAGDFVGPAALLSGAAILVVGAVLWGTS